jgi:hypothetical protein
VDGSESRTSAICKTLGAINMDNRTEEILSRFDESWTETEHRFDELINKHCGFDRLKLVRQFISHLRQKGHDKYFRLGTSMHTLIISRSVNFGLRTDQKHIKIEAFDNKFEVIFRDGEKVYREYMVDNLNDTRVTKLLQTLKDTLVD